MDKLITICIVTISCVALTACGQSKKSTNKGNTSKATKGYTDKKPTLLQATTQKTLPGRPESEPHTERNFVIVWNSSEEPQGFFWRGNGTWEPCNINSVKNYKPLVVKDDGRPFDMNYDRDFDDRNYAKGDTLELYVTTGDKHPVPAEVPADATNTLFYKKADNKWHALPVNNITKLPTIAMP